MQICEDYSIRRILIEHSVKYSTAVKGPNIRVRNPFLLPEEISQYCSGISENVKCKLISAVRKESNRLREGFAIDIPDTLRANVVFPVPGLP